MQAHRVGGARSPSWIARAALLTAFAFLALAAHAPWVRAGLSVADYGARLGASAGPTADWQRLLPLPLPGEPALAEHLEALLCLALFAAGMASFLRRSLAPWAGEERARTAGHLMVVFFLLHPLLVEGAAPEAARGARLALALAGLASALFLAGRQEGRDARTAVAVVLFLCAGFFSSAPAPLCLLFSFAEYVSAHRHRPRGLRARTAAVTALVFASAAILPRFVVAEPGAEPASPRAFVLACVDGLGRLCIPSPEAAGVFGVLACGAALLLSFQPLLRAARQAPRLWGGVCGSWSVGLSGALAWWSAAQTPESRAGRALLALAVFCAGLALFASALSSERARWTALALALCFTPVAHAGGRGVLRAGAAVAEQHRHLAAHVPPGAEPVLVLVEPARAEAAPSLGWLLHPALVEGSRAPDSVFAPARVRGLTPEGLALLLRSPLAERECPAGSSILFPDGTLRRRPAARTGARAFAPWRDSLGVSFEDGLDPLALEGLEVVAELGAQPSELEVLAWRTREGRVEEVRGHVFEQRGRRVARFDLSAALPWLLAGEVRDFFLPRGRRAIERAEFLERLPRPEGVGEPVASGADWLFLAAPPFGSEPVLTLLRTSDLASTVRAVTSDSDGRLRAHDLASFLTPARAARKEVLWALEFRADGQVLARSSGVWNALP